jgi:hypothetical protein
VGQGRRRRLEDRDRRRRANEDERERRRREAEQRLAGEPVSLLEQAAVERDHVDWRAELDSVLEDIRQSLPTS